MQNRALRAAYYYSAQKQSFLIQSFGILHIRTVLCYFYYLTGIIPCCMLPESCHTLWTCPNWIWSIYIYIRKMRLEVDTIFAWRICIHLALPWNSLLLHTTTESGVCVVLMSGLTTVIPGHMIWAPLLLGTTTSNSTFVLGNTAGANNIFITDTAESITEYTVRLLSLWIPLKRP